MRLLLSLIFTLASSAAFALPMENVQYGGEEDLDACGGSGIVLVDTVLITKNSEGYVDFNTVVPAGTTVSFCDGDEGYTGVVIEEEGMDCKTGSPVTPRKDYDGPCKSGWIKSLFLELLAG